MTTTKSRKNMATKKKRLEDIYYPVPADFNPIGAEKPTPNKEAIKRIIQDTVRLAYSLKPVDRWDSGHSETPQALATSEQMAMAMHLVEALQPTDAIEAALASQFVVTYIRAMKSTSSMGSFTINLDLFKFGHEVLEALQKYRCKGAQQISVQYNVNQGQVVNIKNVKKDERPVTLEGTGT